MYLRRTVGLGLAVVTAATIMITAAGAGTSRLANAKIDLSTRAAVAKYLRSIHVNPKGVVVQRGVRNYAGSSCPGAGWTCTSSSHPVVQVASGDGRNVFQCASSSCAVVQTATTTLATNTAKCIRTTGITQSCSISQSSATANNEAIVVQIAKKTSGLTQNASQTAQIIQKATGGNTVANSNTACVLQTTEIEGSTGVAKKGMPVTVTLNAHQSISIKQDSLFGGNTVKNADATTTGCDNAGTALTQSHTITSKATGSASITQDENAAGNLPNALLDIEQNKSEGFENATGSNTSAFAQTSDLAASASTPAAPPAEVKQTQSSLGGGLQANVDQFSHGVSTSTATQSERQCEHAQSAGTPAACDVSTHTPNPPGYTLTQKQYGPVRCCSNQADNDDDTFTVTQTSIQSNDVGGNSQSNDVQADCTTSGNCTATQTTTVNGTTTVNAQTGSDVHAQTNCSGSECTTETTNPDLIPHTDIAEFGYGGMRTDGTGSIDVTGVSGTVTKALLYWNGPTNSTDQSANGDVTFDGQPVTGENIGFASSNCWDQASPAFINSQSYRADVTSFVTGNGTYSLSDFTKPAVEGPPVADINGVSLIVLYDDGDTSNDRNVAIWDGNDSNVTPYPYQADGWDETINGVPYPGSGSASLDLVVSDGQFADPDDAALVLNGSTLVPAGHIFSGETLGGDFDASGSLWDVKSFDITSRLSSGSNNLHLTTGFVNDCISLVVAMANVPASSGPVITSPAGPQQQTATPQAGSTPAPSRQSTRALPWAPEFGGLVRTAPSPLRGVQSGGALVQR
jgi:hypothetical protein